MCTPIIAFVHNELCVLSYYKAQFHYVQKQWKQEQKGFYIKTMQVGLVKKVLKQDD